MCLLSSLGERRWKYLLDLSPFQLLFSNDPRCFPVRTFKWFGGSSVLRSLRCSLLLPLSFYSVVDMVLETSMVHSYLLIFWGLWGIPWLPRFVADVTHGFWGFFPSCSLLIGEIQKVHHSYCCYHFPKVLAEQRLSKTTAIPRKKLFVPLTLRNLHFLRVTTVTEDP